MPPEERRGSSRSLSIALTAAEDEETRRQAAAAGLSRAEWARRKLFGARAP